MKNFIILSCTFLNLLFCSNFIHASELHEDYRSIHDVGTTIYYTNLSGVSQSEVRYGFEDIYDLNDPKVECHSESPCPAGDEELNLPTMVWGSTSNKPLTQNYRYRVFIPPGAVKIDLNMFMESQAVVYASVSYKNPPVCSYCTSIDSSVFINEDTYTLEELDDDNTDVYLQNAGGHIIIFSKSTTPQDPATGINAPLTETGAGWLYINIFTGSTAVGQIQYAIEVNKTDYLNWYNNYNWTQDRFGLNEGSTPSTDPEFSVSLEADTIAGEVSLDVVFTPTVSNGTPPYTYSWDFDSDGIADTEDISASTFPSYNQSHTYYTIGNYTALLTVTDSNGDIATASKTIFALDLGEDTFANGYTEGLLLVSGYSTGYAAGYTAGYDDGKQACIDDPASCGISTSTETGSSALVDAETLNITINSLLYEEIRYDIQLDYDAANYSWTLNPEVIIRAGTE